MQGSMPNWCQTKLNLINQGLKSSSFQILLIGASRVGGNRSKKQHQSLSISIMEASPVCAALFTSILMEGLPPWLHITSIQTNNIIRGGSRQFALWMVPPWKNYMTGLSELVTPAFFLSTPQPESMMLSLLQKKSQDEILATETTPCNIRNCMVKLSPVQVYLGRLICQKWVQNLIKF